MRDDQPLNLRCSAAGSPTAVILAVKQNLVYNEKVWYNTYQVLKILNIDKFVLV